MLFGVAAILVTSVALSGATGASAMPESSAAVNSPLTRSAPAALPAATSHPYVLPASETTGYVYLGGTSPVDSASALFAPVRGLRPASGSVNIELLPRLGGRALLDQLSLLQATDIAAFVSANPESVAQLLVNPPSAKSVAGWWSLASESSRDAFLAGAPELAGNLDGLPMALRDEANRVVLSESIAEAERTMPDLGRAKQVDAAQRLHMLGEIRKSLVTRAGQPARHLLQLDTVWPGRAAVVIGDLETADYVSYFVPGMFFSTDRLIVEWAVIAEDLYTEQAEWVANLGRTDASLRGKSVATVAWIGYETPGILDIASLDLAREGAKSISSAVDGVKATRPGDGPYLTLLTHSYGSTATLMALADGAMEVDALVLIGSPGSAAQSVDDIRMPSDRVFVGEAAWDPVTNSAFFGSDPGAPSFGAQTMSVAGGIDPITGRALATATGHLGYFDIGTEAMRNMSLVGLDRGDLVTGVDKATRGTLLAGGR